jgi:hypothetical protein
MYSKPWITGPAMFWIFMIIVVGALYMGFTKSSKSPEAWLIGTMKVSSEERMLRQMQDPLAMRIYALSKVRFSYDDSREKMSKALIEQWDNEIEAVGKDAYHMRAVAAWDAADLDPEAREILKAVHEKAAKAAQEQAAAQDGSTW